MPRQARSLRSGWTIPRSRRTATASVIGAGLVALVTLLPATASPGAAPGYRTLHYHGARISVPASWPVYNLTTDPTRCVRFDVHAVYLGHPGENQNCPAHLVGRTSALLIQPNDAQVARDAASPDSSGQVQVVTANSAVAITATYSAATASSSLGSVRSMLSRTSLAATRSPAGKPADKPVGDPASKSASKLAANPPAPISSLAMKQIRFSAVNRGLRISGVGFDTCAAPSRAAMHDWAQSAPFRAVGIYIGGVNRACDYGNLGPSWVSQVHSYGLHVIPTYVGLQAPCSGVGQPISLNRYTATKQGHDAAVDAIYAMNYLGMPAPAPVYLDMEQYTGNEACLDVVRIFTSAWTKELHAYGFQSGFYSSSLGDLVRHHSDSDFAIPDAIWIARWNYHWTVYGDQVVPDNYWVNHARIHQDRGPHYETWGNFRINVDSDYLDGPVG